MLSVQKNIDVFSHISTFSLKFVWNFKDKVKGNVFLRPLLGDPNNKNWCMFFFRFWFRVKVFHQLRE